MPPAFSALAPAGASTGQALFGVNVVPKGLGFLPRLAGPGFSTGETHGHEKKGRQEILMGGRTSATRPKGNGPGYGGPAKGARRGNGREAFTPEAQPAPDAKRAGYEVAAEIKARIAAHKDAILNAQLERATDVAHPAGHAAAVDLLNRIAPPESKQIIAGDADAPLAFTIVTGVPRAED